MATAIATTTPPTTTTTPSTTTATAEGFFPNQITKLSDGANTA
jgi:hypothetical protein